MVNPFVLGSIALLGALNHPKYVQVTGVHVDGMFVPSHVASRTIR